MTAQPNPAPREKPPRGPGDRTAQTVDLGKLPDRNPLCFWCGRPLQPAVATGDSTLWECPNRTDLDHRTGIRKGTRNGGRPHR